MARLFVAVVNYMLKNRFRHIISKVHKLEIGR